MSDKLYLDRESEESDIALYSKHFGNHMMAMTAEDLHSKSDIAIELASRDIKIQALQDDNALLEAKVKELGITLKYHQDHHGITETAIGTAMLFLNKYQPDRAKEELEIGIKMIDELTTSNNP